MRDYSPERTYTLEDLENWDFPGTSLAVLGYPVRHSISPQMHNAALAKLANKDSRFRSWRYFRFETPPEQLIESLPKFHEKGFLGLNLTVPHKEIALPVIEKIDDSASCIKAVNTLLKTASGYDGFNTDGYGLKEGIRLELGLELKGSRIYLLGAGGAARAAAALCIQEGCAALSIINRNQDRLSNLISDLKPLAKAAKLEIERWSSNDQSLEITPGSIVSNATSLGLKSDDPLPIVEGALQSEIALYDMIYNPPETKLMKRVRELGGKTANGLSMLVYQGVKSLGIWTTEEIPSDAMVKAAHEAMTTRVVS